MKIGRVTDRGTTEIDARGKYVSPGWIDMMDQSGGVLPRNGLAENKLQQGVTTAIGGEGGFPVAGGANPRVLRRAREDRHQHQLRLVLQRDPGPRAVLGTSARAPNAAELDRMRAIMDTAMRAGAMGMTTALIYPPSSYATTDELIEMAKVAAKYGGVYASHIRGEGAEVVQSVSELITIAEKAGLPGEVFHLKVAHKPSWGVRMDSVRQIIDAARARGVDVAADLYVYTAGGTGLEATIPSWAFEGGDRFAQGASRESRRFARGSSASSRPDHRAGGTSSRRPAAGTASSSSTRATRRTRSTSRSRSPRSRGS